MRTIKFRAWDNQSNRMMPDYQWIDSRDPHMGGGVHRSFQFSFDGRNRTAGTTASAYHEVMQFTGLTDKNGKEIYEGDVIEIVHREGNKVTTVCEWCEEDSSFHLFGNDSGIYSVSYSGSAVEGKYVTGNIYQNPDLIPP